MATWSCGRSIDAEAARVVAVVRAAGRGVRNRGVDHMEVVAVDSAVGVPTVFSGRDDLRALWRRDRRAHCDRTFRRDDSLPVYDAAVFCGDRSQRHLQIARVCGRVLTDELGGVSAESHGRRAEAAVE